eukprot:Em0001g1017a
MPVGTGKGYILVRQSLVLPKEFRKLALNLAHSIPTAGHLGKKKTVDHILHRFYWPGVYRDVTSYCKSCAGCQKLSGAKVTRAPLVPLPVISVPFERIAMDIVGPLPRSSRGNKYVLVVCDYATRYPEAIAMQSVEAERVAEELVTLFTRTDGLVERFNRTLKTMLRKTAVDEGKDWDRVLPYVLFAYREALRGPLDVLKETWEGNDKSPESVVSHILMMQDRMEAMKELVMENMRKAQASQKRWYDQNARDRELKVGSKVLVLLPSSTNKLLAPWQGPYVVLKQVGTVDYEIDMHDHRKRKRIFHVNMLREFSPPSDSMAVGYWCAEEAYLREPRADDGEVPVWREELGSELEACPVMGEQLTTEQKELLAGVLKEFAGVFSDLPGRTSLAEHPIECGSARPIRLAPYRIPHAYRKAVQQEISEMLEGGVIEPSASEWCSPMVIVQKRDGALRICVDYRKLNSVSQVDAYPMPRIDDILDHLGKSQYISTMDLTRGYWQVPVEQQARPKTTFATPFGLFQFKMMPFGLQGAPATFQRFMDQVIQGMDSFASAYLDDLIIFSSSWEDHMRHLHCVLERLVGAGLTVKSSKCQFGMSKCSKDEDTGARAFLGLMGYYRRFIPNYSAVALPLTELTKKMAPTTVTWTLRCETAFPELKRLLCSTPVLASPDFEKPFILQTDASEYGVGAVLSQLDEAGGDHPIAYFSRKLLPREVRYSTVEKECLAIKLGIETFRVYLLGRKFTVETDHRSLVWLNKLKESNSRLTRWSLALQPYQYTVVHRAGLSNGNADALSRVNMGTDQDRATKEFVAEEGGWSVKEQRKGSREKIKHQVDTKTSCPPKERSQPMN